MGEPLRYGRVNLITIVRLGAKSLRMVQRYAAVDTTHMHDAGAKLMKDRLKTQGRLFG